MQEILDLLIQYGYVILFFYSLGGGFVALVVASVLCSFDKLDLSLTLIVAILANFLGDLLLFYLAHNQRALIHTYLKKQRRKLALIHILMRKHGSVILIFKKYIYGLKTLVPLAVALTSYPYLKFCLYNFIGAVIWGLSIGLLGYFFGEILMNALKSIEDSSLLTPLFILCLLGGLWFWLTKATKKHNFYESLKNTHSNANDDSQGSSIKSKDATTPKQKDPHVS